MWWRILILFPQMSSPRGQEALLYVFEDNEAVIWIIIKKKSYNETCFQDSQSCSWLVVWSNWSGPKKSKSSTPTPNTNSLTHYNQKKFHAWWVESFVDLVQYQPFQFYSVLWNNGETISTRFRWRASHSKIATYDECYCQDAVVRIVLNFSKPGEEDIREVKIHGDQLKEKTRSGRPDKGTDLFEASNHHFHEQFMETFSSTDYSKLDDDRAWFSQEWKTETTAYDR